MATNKPFESGKDVPASVLHSQQQQPEKVTEAAADSTYHVTTPIEAQKRSTADAAKGPQPKILVAADPLDQQNCFSQDGWVELEISFCTSQYPDMHTVRDLSSKLKVSERTVTEWFEYRRSVMKFFQMQAMRQQQEYNQQLLAQGISSATMIPQAGDSTKGTGPTSRSTGEYLTVEQLNYLEYLFSVGLRCPNANCTSQLATLLKVPQQCLAVWFEHRFDAWKKEQANLEHGIREMQQQNYEQRQQIPICSTDSSQVSLCSEPFKVSNEPRPVEKYPSDGDK